jgi:hypothetical protein
MTLWGQLSHAFIRDLSCFFCGVRAYTRYNPNAIADFMGRLFLELPDHKIEAQVNSMMARYIHLTVLHFSPHSVIYGA